MMLALLADSVYDCLQQLYQETSGDQWTDSTNWQTSEDYCTYSHVTCVSGYITELDFTSNNMQGTLPECISELPVSSLSFYKNGLEGKVPELPSTLVSLDLRSNKFTEWPSTLLNGKLSDLKASSTWLRRVHLDLFKINSVDVSGLWMELEAAAEVDITSTSLKMAYNNFSLLTIRSIGPASTIDLTNTSVKSVPLDLSAVRITTFNAGNTNLTLLNPYVGGAKVVDISGGRAVYTFANPGSSCKIFALRNMHLSGYAPTIEQVDALIGESDLTYDLDGSIFLCDGDALNAADCELASVEAFIVSAGSIRAYFQSWLYLDPIASGITLAIKNQEKSDDHHVVLDYFTLQGIETNDTQIMLQFSAPGYSGSVNTQNAALLYGGKQFSSGDINMQEEVRQILSNHTKESYTEESHAFTPYTIQNTRNYSIIVTGMSQCPYYTDYINQYIYPFYQKYQAIAQHIHYDYVCFSSFKEGYYTQASSLHGQYESFTDSALVCARDKADDNQYVEFYHCFTETIQARKCVRQYFDEGVANDIFQCMADEYVDLFKIDQQRTADLDSHASPTLFLQRAGYEPFEVSDMFFTVDGFKRVICKHFSEIKECAE